MKKASIFTIIMILIISGNLVAFGTNYTGHLCKKHDLWGKSMGAGTLSWTYAGHLFDDQIFDYNNNWAPITYPDVDSANYPSPGPPDGELFDFEGSKCAYDDDYLYFAITSSFGMGVDYGRFYYQAGDFFFGFNGADAAFGIDMAAYAIYENTFAPFGIPAGVPLGYHDHAAIADAAGPFAIDTDNSNYLGDADGSLHLATEFVDNDTYVLEMRIAKSIFTGLGIDFANVHGISLRQTIACGNDYIEETYDSGVIPEPGTLTLLGLGILGIGLATRRKK